MQADIHKLCDIQVYCGLCKSCRSGKAVWQHTQALGSQNIQCTCAVTGVICQGADQQLLSAACSRSRLDTLWSVWTVTCGTRCWRRTTSSAASSSTRSPSCPATFHSFHITVCLIRLCAVILWAKQLFACSVNAVTMVHNQVWSVCALAARV